MIDDLAMRAYHNIDRALAMAEETLRRPINDQDRMYRSGPQHRHRKHRWDFTTLGTTWCVRHARRRTNTGNLWGARRLQAATVPLAFAAGSGVGFVVRVILISLKTDWYMGYSDPQGDESLRKDFVRIAVQDGAAEIKRLTRYSQEHPNDGPELKPLWDGVRRDLQALRHTLAQCPPKVAGSHRLGQLLDRVDAMVDQGTKPLG